MYNRCNSNASSRNSSCGYGFNPFGCGCNCGCNSFGCGNAWGNFWNTSFQSICRDCCGNIRVNNGGRCGCQRNNGCLYASNTAQTANDFSCAYTGNATSTASGCGNQFCQQGLTTTNGCSGTTFGSCGCARRRSRSGCGCGYGYGYDIEDYED